MKTILFFDDFMVNRQKDMVRRFHKPEWLPEKTFVYPGRIRADYTSVVPSPHGGYYMFMADIRNDEGYGLLCAAAPDGLSWKALEGNDSLSADDRDDSGWLSHFKGGGWVYHDPFDRDPSMRYKMPMVLLPQPCGVCMAYSAYGDVWRLDRRHVIHPRESDTVNSLLYNHRTGRYQMTMRRAPCERRIFMTDSADLQDWSTPRLVLHPDSLDAAMVHLYGMPQFSHEEMFVGFLWVYQTRYDDSSRGKTNGTVQTELVYSYDGVQWNRTHETFMPLAPEGEYGHGSMYGTAIAERAEDILVYALAKDLQHGESIADNQETPYGYLLPGTMRKQGFVGLAGKHGAGEMTTDCIYPRTSDLALNIFAPSSGVQVQICDCYCKPYQGYTFAECEEIRGNHLSARPRWKLHADLSGAIDQSRTAAGPGWIRIQFRLNGAELYAIRGDFGVAINSGGKGLDYL